MAFYKTFGFIKKSFFTAVIFIGCNVSNINPLKCVSMNNQECKIIKKIDINNNEPSFYPYNILVNKCSGSFSNISDRYAKLCVLDLSINVKVFNLMSKTNETRIVNLNAD